MNKIKQFKGKDWYKKRLASINRKLQLDITPIPKPKPKAVPVSIRKTYKSEKDLYYKRVWEVTNANNLTLLPNHHRRGFKDYHLDHIIPIAYGYRNYILPQYIGAITNLRFIPRRDNLKKRDFYIPPTEN